jgi:23S rRNA (adenine-N6)-dimethyltransferase
MYWIQKRLLSQNFLTNRKLVKQLIRDSSISSDDLVLEIGAGKGIITTELLNVSKKVWAIELDANLHENLGKNIGSHENLKLILGNILDITLPAEPYKVFANIPFSISGDVIRKLLQAENSPSDAYLVFQAEASSKFVPNTSSNTMAAILYYPWWNIKVVHKFNRPDFTPQPKIDSVLLHLQPRLMPLLSKSLKIIYQDFVTFHFIHDRHAKFIPPDEWLKIFNSFINNSSPEKLKSISGSFAKLQSEQRNLQKIHRSRTDKNWRKFKLKK